MLNVSMDTASFRRFERCMYYLAPPLYCVGEAVLFLYFVYICVVDDDDDGV